MRVDKSIGDLVAGVEKIGLTDRVHYVVVSDHGMAALSPDRMIVLDDYIDVATADVVDWAPVLALDAEGRRRRNDVRGAQGQASGARRLQAQRDPAEYGLAGHPRLPAIVAIAKEGWYISSKAEVVRWGEPDRRAPGGAHGYDARLASMHGLFIANGPRITSGMRVKAFENIHVYDFMCAVLGLQPAKNDGDPAVTRDMLRLNR